MEVFALGGFFVIIGVILGLASTIVGLFFGNIIVFDSIGIAILAGTFFANLGIHSAIALLLGIAVFFALFFLSHHEYGFWVVSGIMSLAWGLVITAIITGWNSNKPDKIWQFVIFGIATAIMIGLHIHARDNA